jgi:hypothetical protein
LNVCDNSSRAAWLSDVNHAWLFVRSGMIVQLASQFCTFVRCAV